MAFFNWPMAASAYTVSQGFKGSAHRGIDMAAPLKTPFYASASGTVVAAGPASGFGQWIVIDHGGFYTSPNLSGTLFSTVYGHMYPGDIFVRVGQSVRQGDRIGLVGNNGESTGPHLHFELWKGKRLAGGTAVDPATAGLGPLGDSNIIGGPEGSPFEDVAQGVVSIADAVKGIVDLVAFLADPKNWVRVGLSVLGTVLLLVGVWSAMKYQSAKLKVG